MGIEQAEAGGASTALYRVIADRGSLMPFGGETEHGNPSDWPGYAAELERARLTSGARHAVTTARVTISGERCVLIGFEFAFLGGSLGTAEGAMIGRAFAAAIAERVPVVCVAASGGMRMQEGTSALTQMQSVAASVGSVRRAGIPFAAVAGDPTTGGVWASLVAAADVALGVDGARISFSGSRTRPAGADPRSADYYAAGKWRHGFLDVLGSADDVRGQLGAFVTLLSPRARADRERYHPGAAGPVHPDSEDAGRAHGQRDGWQQVLAARQPGRVASDRWLASCFGTRFEIRGDRAGGVDHGIRCGFGLNGGQTFGYIAQSGQATTAAGYRTATRLIGLAERFGCPVLTLIDTPGAASGPADEASGIGTAIAELLVAVASCSVPITSVVTGEGVSGGAIALGAPGNLWIAPDGYLSVAAPELAASILKRGPDDIAEIASLLRLTPADLTARGIVRGVTSPPAESRPAPQGPGGTGTADRR